MTAKRKGKQKIKENKCLSGLQNLGQYGFETPHDVNTDMSFCLEHARNTCCNSTNVDLIKNKIAVIRVTGREISQECIEETTKMFCSL